MMKGDGGETGLTDEMAEAAVSGLACHWNKLTKLHPMQ
jgi:hypothetical protein